MTQQTETKNFIEICPGCLACYNQGRLTFYWFQINKDTTLAQIERALDVEEIHRRAKTPFVCGGEEVHIQDNDFGGGEYMTAKELYGYVELLQLVPNFDYIKAFKEVYLMSDEFQQLGSGIQYEPSEQFKEFADSVQVFDNIDEQNTHLEYEFMEIYDVSETDRLINYIDWATVRHDMLIDMNKAEVNGKIYLWRGI
jgi:hypothetical protein